MRRSFIAVALMGGLLAAPASAEMSVATFLAKADALKAKGMMAMMSPDLAKIKAEMNKVGAGYRAQLQADKVAGRKPHSCPPPKSAMNSEELIGHFRAIPVAQRPQISTKTAFYSLMKKKYPCPA
jgi:hypothetical protein